MDLYRDRGMQEILFYSLILLLAHLSHLLTVSEPPNSSCDVWFLGQLYGGCSSMGAAALWGLRLIHWTVLKPNYYVV